MLKINLKKLNPFSGFNAQDLLAVEINNSGVKIALIKTYPNKKELSFLASRQIAGLSDPEISKIIRESVSTINSKNFYTVVTIPSNLAITKNIEIPSTDPKEIREIINLQAGRHTPYSREEIMVDYIDLGIYKHSYTKILLIIISRNIIKRHSDILDKAGIKLDKVVFAPECLALSASSGLKILSGDSPAGLVHIDENLTEFMIILRNKLLFVRSIPIGITQFAADKDRSEARLSDELKRSIEAYQGENIDKNPLAIVLTGAIEEGWGLEPLLSKTFQANVKAVPYLRNIPLRQDVLQAANLSKRVSFLNVIASLLAYEDAKINLIPEDVKLKKQIVERGKELIKTGIFSLAIFVLVFFILISKLYFKISYLKKLDTKYKPLTQEAAKLEQDFSKISMIRSHLANRGYSLEVLTAIYELAPLELQLSNIRFDQGFKFSIRGSATARTTVFSMVDAMEKSPFYKDVKIKYTSTRREEGRDLTDFEINCSLTREAVK